VRRRLSVIGLIPKITSKEQDEAIANQGRSKFDGKQVIEGISMLVLGNDLETACQCAADFIDNNLKTPSVEGLVECIRVIELIQTANITKVQPQTKHRVLVHCLHFGVYKAIWYGMFEILIAMSSHLVKIGADTNPSFREFTEQVIDTIKAFKDNSDPAPSFVKVPMKFTTKAIQQRYDTFLAALS